MATKNRINLGYRARAWQHEAHKGLKGKRNGLWICSRQIGKTVAAIAELVDRTLRGPPNSNTWYICPAQTQARRIAWPELKSRLSALRDHVTFSETTLMATLPGDRKIYLLGAESGDNIRGSSFKTIVADERDSIGDEFWRNVMLPTLNAWGDQSFVLNIGTLAGGDSTLWRMYMEHRDDPLWSCRVVPATKAGVFDQKWLDYQQQVMGRSAFLREMECDPAAPVENAVLGELLADAQRDGRIEPIPYREGVAVQTSWDLGVRDFTTVWGCMHWGRWIEYLFYREYQGLSIVEIMRRLVDEFPGYSWGEAVLPHDGKSRALSGTGVAAASVEDHFLERWPGSVFTVKNAPSPVATLQAARKNMPRANFNVTHCEQGILRLKSARYVVEPKTGTVTDRILHDDNSHALDAFRLGMWRLEGLGDPMANRELMSQKWTNNPAYFE